MGEAEVLTWPIEDLYEVSEKYMVVMCGLDKDNKRAEKTKKKAFAVREKVFDGLSIDFLLQRFDKESIDGSEFVFGNERMVCHGLSKIEKKDITEGYMFMFHSPMPDISQLPISEMYLADSWQTCFVDAGRDLLQEHLLKICAKKQGKELYITDTLAPGMYGMAPECVRSFFKLLPVEKIGLEIMDSGMMSPVKSFVGIFLLLDQEAVISSMNCDECLSNHKHCEYCRNYAKRYIENDEIERK